MTQLEMGIDVEEEHKDTYKWLEDYVRKNKKLPPDKDFYESIAKDHISEISDYYSKLMKANL